MLESIPLTKTSKTLWVERVALLGAVLLFPGFFIYHLLLSRGDIQPIAGGLFGPASAALCLYFLLTSPFFYRRTLAPASIYFVLFIGLALFTATWTFVYAVFEPTEAVRSAAIQSISTIVIWVALFFVGAYLPLCKRPLRLMMLAGFIGIFLFLLNFYLTTGSLMFYARQYYGAEEGVATYQGFATSAVVTIILLLSIIERFGLRVFVIVAGIFVLFLLGARSELYGFLLLVAIWMLVQGGRSIKWLITTGVAALIVCSVVILQFERLVESRQLEVLDLSRSTSWSARSEYQERAWGQIKENPVFGRFGGHVSDSNKVGGYTHNLLSAWVSYGLLGFCWYVGLTLVALVASARIFIFRNRLDVRWSAAFSLNFFCLVLMLVSKPVFWVLPALGWGLYVNARVADQRARW